MKKYLITTILGLSFMVLCQDTTFAQWDYGQDSIYNIVDSRIDRRKTAARIRARQAANKNRKNNAVRRKSSRKNLRRNSRRASMLENFVVPKMKLDADLPKRTVIV